MAGAVPQHQKGGSRKDNANKPGTLVTSPKTVREHQLAARATAAKRRAERRGY